jgi:hypothetical protein
MLSLSRVRVMVATNVMARLRESRVECHATRICVASRLAATIRFLRVATAFEVIL